jgi:uncharacterized lipoprotein YajG
MKQIFNLKGVKMKKGLFLLASVAMLMLAGCGESGGVTSANSDGGVGSTPVNNGIVVAGTVGAQEVAVTTPKNLYGIADMGFGTPPPLPSE